MAILTDNVLYDNYADYDDDSREPSSRIGLVGYWSMNEGSGNKIFDRVGKNNGTLQENPQWKEVTDFPGADSRKVLEFDGEDDYITFGSFNTPLGEQSYTISAWLKPKEMRDALIAGWRNSLSDEHSIRLYRSGIHFVFFNTILGNITNLTDDWHHIASTFDGTNIKGFLDGKLVESSQRGDILNNK